jgi:hypothetical protein
MPEIRFRGRSDITRAGLKKAHRFYCDDVNPIILYDENQNILKPEEAYWEGDFNCSERKLTTLVGAPKYIFEGSFNCSFNRLTSLEGMPEYIHGNFHGNNNSITGNLEAFTEVTGSIYLSSNHISSLEGSPIQVNGNFYCDRNNLKSLNGAPRVITNDFNCSRNFLETLEGSPESVGRDYVCFYNRLLSLDGIQKDLISGSLNCLGNKLDSFNSFPKRINYHLVCDHNNFTNLEGMPNVGHDFTCRTNNLESLKGCQKEINGNIYLEDNKLKSLEYAPEFVGGIFNVDKNPLESLEYSPNSVTEFITNIDNIKDIRDTFSNHIPKKSRTLCFNSIAIQYPDYELYDELKEIFKNNKKKGTIINSRKANIKTWVDSLMYCDMAFNGMPYGLYDLNS